MHRYGAAINSSTEPLLLRRCCTHAISPMLAISSGASGIDYVSIAAFDDLIPSHVVFSQNSDPLLSTGVVAEERSHVIMLASMSSL
ncbi:hypothetical protein BHE74_00008231 [Ensete ventricosum]|nr:hypothetical protein BHE74_00008231 [Ensete ventricosum]